MEQHPNSIFGRKVFFLNPHSVFNEGLLFDIRNKGYEVYVLNSHEHALKAIRKFPGSILFINIDEGLREQEWENLIKSILKNPELNQTKIGILTYNNDKLLSEKYLIDFGLPCGFIRLNQGLAESERIILITLEANEALGRRRYVRARCNDRLKASFNVKLKSKIHIGIIYDISTAGMTYSFDKELFFDSKSHIDDIQLKLRGSLCLVSGTFMGEVLEGTPRNLLMFDVPHKEGVAEKIDRFIFKTLQEEMINFLTAN